MCPAAANVSEARKALWSKVFRASYVSRIEKRALEKLRQELQDGPAPQLVRRRPHSSGT